LTAPAGNVDPRRTGALVALLLWNAASFAHHGVAPHYDDSKRVEIDGVIAKFEFINPHSFVHVRTVDAAGAQQVWQCELASRTVLARNGLTADTFKPGERVTIEGSQGRKNPTGCALRVAHFADGGVLRSTELFGPVATGPAELPADTTSIAGVWTMKRFSVSRYEGALTQAGERARAAFDPVEDDPAIYCDPASPVRFWVNVNEPFEIRIAADEVVVDHRFMDHRRVVHLQAAPPPADLPRSSMGYSVGRFEGRALVITTGHFTAAALEPRYGVMHTENLQLTERLEVNDSGELKITWVIDDPEYFAQPHTQTEYFVRSRRDPEPYACRPGYQQ
jgi:hypothetical protein